MFFFSISFTCISTEVSDISSNNFCTLIIGSSPLLRIQCFGVTDEKISFSSVLLKTAFVALRLVLLVAIFLPRKIYMEG